MSSNRLSVVEDIEELNHWAAKSINNIRLKGKLQMNIKRGDKHERINLEYRQRKALGNQIWKDTIKKKNIASYVIGEMLIGYFRIIYLID